MNFIQTIVLALCLEAAVAYSNTSITQKVYFNIKIGERDIGTITIGLFGYAAPRTVKNFVAFVNGHEGHGYQGSRFHRIIPKFMMQGGDFLNGDGTGSISIYGPKFDDEAFHLENIGAGWVGMANAGPNTNGSQFYINFVPTPWLNGAHVVFGKVLSGMPVVRAVEHVRTGEADRPLDEVIIADCGEIPVSEPYEEAELKPSPLDV